MSRKALTALGIAGAIVLGGAVTTNTASAQAVFYGPRPYAYRSYRPSYGYYYSRPAYRPYYGNYYRSYRAPYVRPYVAPSYRAYRPYRGWW